MQIVVSFWIVLWMLLRRLVAGKIPWRCYEFAWLLLAARLLLPASLSLSVQWLPPVAVPGARLQSSASQLWPLVRMAGAMFMAIPFAVQQVRFWREQRSIQRESEETFFDVPQRPFFRKVQIFYSSQITTPMTYGWIRPVILLPVPSPKREKSNPYVLLHEWYHVRRLDVLKKGFVLLAVLWNWFNPFAWLLLGELSRDLELCCDACALREANREARAQYAHLLVDCQQKMRSPVLMFHGGNTQERVVAIMKQKSKSRIGAAVIGSFVGILFVLTLFVKPNAVSVPNVRGLSFFEADSLLEEKGFSFAAEADNINLIGKSSKEAQIWLEQHALSAVVEHK
jgi:beta-lactamase regulating signal transducer with metallopeptidase domain